MQPRMVIIVVRMFALLRNVFPTRSPFCPRLNISFYHRIPTNTIAIATIITGITSSINIVTSITVILHKVSLEILDSTMEYLILLTVPKASLVQPKCHANRNPILCSSYTGCALCKSHSVSLFLQGPSLSDPIPACATHLCPLNKCLHSHPGFITLASIFTHDVTKGNVFLVLALTSIALFELLLLMFVVQAAC